MFFVQQLYQKSLIIMHNQRVIIAERALIITGIPFGLSLSKGAPYLASTGRTVLLIKPESAVIFEHLQ